MSFELQTIHVGGLEPNTPYKAVVTLDVFENPLSNNLPLYNAELRVFTFSTKFCDIKCLARAKEDVIRELYELYEPIHIRQVTTCFAYEFWIFFMVSHRFMVVSADMQQIHPVASA